MLNHSHAIILACNKGGLIAVLSCYYFVILLYSKTIIISTFTSNYTSDHPCPLCLPFVGKIMIDDVWSGGTSKDGPYPLMSSAIEAGLYHPNCKDSHSTYFPGITTADDKFTKDELVKVSKDYQKDQHSKYSSRQVEKYRRLMEYSLDQENKNAYKRKYDEWNSRNKSAVVYSNKNDPDMVPDFIKTETERILTELEEQYGYKIKRIIPEMYGENKKAPFTFIPEKIGKTFSPKLNINDLYEWGESLEEFNARIRENYESGFLTAKNIEDLLYHEYIHFLTFKDCKTWEDFVNREEFVRKLYVPGISIYADLKKDGAESIAEAAVKIRNGEKVDEKSEMLVHNLLKFGIIYPKKVE